MPGESSDFLKRFIDEFYAIKGIIISDSEGIHICSSFNKDAKDQSEKFIQTSTLLISAVGQTDSNLAKTKAKSNLLSTNFYFGEQLIHIEHSENMMVTLFMKKQTNIASAKEISGDIIQAFEKLNAEIPKIKSLC